MIFLGVTQRPDSMALEKGFPWRPSRKTNISSSRQSGTPEEIASRGESALACLYKGKEGEGIDAMHYSVLCGKAFLVNQPTDTSSYILDNEIHQL